MNKQEKEDLIQALYDVEYLRRTFYTLSDAKRNADFYNKHYNGEWKILKYGRPITVELNNKIKKES